MDMAVFILGLGIGSILAVIGIGTLVLWIMKDTVELQGCKNCSHYWNDCGGQECGACEEWEVRE